MTASEEHAGLHKRWLERKLEIEVGKVQAKLLSKGFNVPVPAVEAVEASLRHAQAHLPRLHLELYGRNPNGTFKPHPEQCNSNGPPPPSTLVQKLDRLLNPALLTPIPDDIAAIHGLPTSCCVSAEPTVSGAGPEAGPMGRTQVHVQLHNLVPLQRHPAGGPAGAGSGASPGTQSGGIVGGGSGGVAHPGHPQQVLTISHGGGVTEPGGLLASDGSSGGAGGGGSGAGAGGGNGTHSGGAANRSRSPPPPPLRPDLQGADARIDDAMELVQRVALQANEMSPRERVLYLARQSNPHFCLSPPRSTRLASLADTHGGMGRSRRDLMPRSSRRITSFSADSEGRKVAGGSSGGGASQRSLAGWESRRSRDSSNPSRPGSPHTGNSGRRRSSEGSLPPLAPGSRSVGRTAAHANTLAAAEDTDGDAPPAVPLGSATASLKHGEGLPPLSPSASPARRATGDKVAHPSGIEHGSSVPLPPLPPVAGGVAAAAAAAPKPTSMLTLWGAAAVARAAEAQAEAVQRAAEAEREAAEAAATGASGDEVDTSDEAGVRVGMRGESNVAEEGGALSSSRQSTEGRHSIARGGAQEAPDRGEGKHVVHPSATWNP